MWMSASLGAIGGFWLSWLTGYRYRHHLHRIRWLNAERLARGQLFLRRHGAWAVFLVDFSLRCAPPYRWSPAPAGPLWQFQLANVSSGLLWPLVLLTPGALSLNF